jgi:hypothetical protein
MDQSSNSRKALVGSRKAQGWEGARLVARAFVVFFVVFFVLRPS